MNKSMIPVAWLDLSARRMDADFWFDVVVRLRKFGIAPSRASEAQARAAIKWCENRRRSPAYVVRAIKAGLPLPVIADHLGTSIDALEKTYATTLKKK